MARGRPSVLVEGSSYVCQLHGLELVWARVELFLCLQPLLWRSPLAMTLLPSALPAGPIPKQMLPAVMSSAVLL